MLLSIILMVLALLAIVGGAIMTFYPKRQKVGAVIVIIGCIVVAISIVMIVDWFLRLLVFSVF